jgi:hypothetical protein
MLYRKIPKNRRRTFHSGVRLMRLPVTKKGRSTSRGRSARSRCHRPGGQLPGYGLALSCRGKRKCPGTRPGRRLPRQGQDRHQAALLDDQQPRGYGHLPQRPAGKTPDGSHRLLPAPRAAGDPWDRLESLGVADFLDKAKADGRIVNAGFSFHGMLTISNGSWTATPGNSARSSTIFSTRKTRPAPKASNMPRQGPGGGDHGTAARRQPGAAHTAGGGGRHLEKSSGKADTGGVGAALGVEPSRSHGRAFRDERRGPHRRKPGHRAQALPNSLTEDELEPG